MHLSTFLATMGQVRFSMLWPFSMMHTERAGSRSVRRQGGHQPADAAADDGDVVVIFHVFSPPDKNREVQ